MRGVCAGSCVACRRGEADLAATGPDPIGAAAIGIAYVYGSRKTTLPGGDASLFRHRTADLPDSVKWSGTFLLHGD